MSEVREILKEVQEMVAGDDGARVAALLDKILPVVVEQDRIERLKRAMESDEVKDIAVALAKAQLQIKGALKDSKNDHYKSSYADLFQVSEACREHLASNGIAVVQRLETLDGKPTLVTKFIHGASGQWLRGEWPIRPQQDTPQGLGSAVTYARRYSLAAMAGVAPRGDDDDGNAASNVGQKKQPVANDSPPRGSWGDLQGEPQQQPPAQEGKPQRQGPVELADLPETVDRLPVDVAKARRELERFAAVPFANMKVDEVKAIARTLDSLAAKASSPKNKLVLTTLAAVATAEFGKRAAGGAA